MLVLDEPTRNFSPLSNPVIRNMLKEFPGAIISVSHDRKYLKEVCNVIYEFTEAGLKRAIKKLFLITRSRKMLSGYQEDTFYFSRSASWLFWYQTNRFFQLPDRF